MRYTGKKDASHIVLLEEATQLAQNFSSALIKRGSREQIVYHWVSDIIVCAKDLKRSILYPQRQQGSICLVLNTSLPRSLLLSSRIFNNILDIGALKKKPRNLDIALVRRTAIGGQEYRQKHIVHDSCHLCCKKRISMLFSRCCTDIHHGLYYRNKRKFESPNWGSHNCKVIQLGCFRLRR